MSKRLYVGGLPYGVTASDLDGLFSKVRMFCYYLLQYGKIVDIAVKDQAQGAVYAFVEFDTDEEADNAQNEMNNTYFMGRTIRVEYTRGKPYSSGSNSIRRGPPQRTNYRVEVTNLPHDCSWQVAFC